MTNPIYHLRQAGYLMPIPRSPAVCLLPDEEIPYPYCYHEILAYEPPDAMKQRFMKALNQRRWQHIINAEVKVKK